MVNGLFPVEISREQGDGLLRCEYLVPASCAFFAGHFPEVAVLPGVIYLKWVFDALPNEYSGLELAQIARLKCSRVTRPDARLFLTIDIIESCKQLKFAWKNSAGATCCTGRLLYR